MLRSGSVRRNFAVGRVSDCDFSRFQKKDLQKTQGLIKPFLADGRKKLFRKFWLYLAFQALDRALGRRGLDIC